ncbi:MAG: mitochondrial fission ELM1 family protein [Alphaproteobacteria bacterium]|nr:mitochondrial fission ELM1 family protein [Alphaproteobacteria bacterium]
MSTVPCWVVTEGHDGMESQARGLAEATGLAHDVKRVRLRLPWTHLPASLLVPPLGAVTPDSDRLSPPWPRLLITCGRRSTGLSMAVRKASEGATFTVHIQDPQIDPRHFDLVVIPAHDRLRGRATGDNILVSQAALHRVTPARLAEEAARFPDDFADLPRPRIAVLIGGSNRYYRLSAAHMRELVAQLAGLARKHRAGLLVTASRRTGDENRAILQAGLEGLAARLWDGAGANPYFAYLAAADAIVVTCDSVSMVSEACATGKPVYVVDLEGGSPRFESFHGAMRAAGCTRPFTGALEHWTYTPPDDTLRIAREVLRRMGPVTAEAGSPAVASQL